MYISSAFPIDPGSSSRQCNHIATVSLLCSQVLIHKCVHLRIYGRQSSLALDLILTPVLYHLMFQPKNVTELAFKVYRGLQYLRPSRSCSQTAAKALLPAPQVVVTQVKFPLISPSRSDASIVLVPKTWDRLMRVSPYIWSPMSPCYKSTYQRSLSLRRPAQNTHRARSHFPSFSSTSFLFLGLADT